MKKKIVGFILIGTALGLGLSTVLFAPKKAVVESKGYTVASLPTTIDLNDTSAANIRNYYSSLNNLSTSERQGNNLLKNLKTILKNGQKYYSYDVDNGSQIWQMYEITDRDWTLSPASSTTYGTYNSSTNKITNYVYGSNSNAKNDPYVHSLYTNRNVTNQAKAWGDHTQTNWGINREHVWPKAEGFESEAAGGARGDPMHLMAGNGYANNIHSNYFYGYVDTSSSYTDCGSKYSYTSSNLLGKSKTVGGSKNVFEPQDSDKGDIARAIFYMVARYNYLSGSDSDGIDSDNPNLSLTQNLSDWSSSSFDSTTTTKGYMGIMTDLLAWHHADPVDSYEIHRNNLLYTNFTNNRNPFIDFPEWVDFIWGTATYSGTTYQSYSSTPTGYATPSSDTINGYNSSTPASVSGVTLNSNSETLDIGGSVTLTEIVSPSNASNKNVTWSSNNNSVATVSNGVVTAVSDGQATITVRSVADNTKYATCTITVNNHVTLNYTNSPFSSTSSSSSAETVNVFGINYENKYGMKYQSNESIEFEKNTDAYLGNTTSYGKSIDRIVINWQKYENSNLLNVFEGTSALPSSTLVSGSTASLVTTYNFTNNNSAYFKIKVAGTSYYTNFSSIEIYFKDDQSQSRTLSSISVSGQQTSFTVGDTFVFGGTVTALFSDNSSANVTSSSSFSGYDMSTSGQQTVTVSYTYEGSTKTTTYQITVSSGVTPTPISGETLDFNIATYATANNWQNSTNYLVINANDVITFTAAGTPVGDYGLNTGKYYTSGTNWRFYQTEGGTLTVSAESGFMIKTVTITFTVANTGTFTYNSQNIDSNQTITVNSTSAIFGVGNTGSVSNGNVRVSNINVVYVRSYTLVTSVNSLGTGDEIVFIGTNNTEHYEATSISNSLLSSVEVSAPSNNLVEFSDDATSFIVEKINGLYRFKDLNNGYLSTKDNSGNYCQYESSSSLTNKSLFSLTINNNGNVSSLVGQDSSVRRYFKFDYNSGNSPYFSCFSSSSSSYSFAIYKKTTQADADAWASSFLTGTQNCSLTQWGSLASSYDTLSSFAKNEIISCVANASSDYSIRSQAMARYEYILTDGRFTDATDFISGRDVSLAKRINNQLFANENNRIIIVIVILLGVSVGSILFLAWRKKQENK